MRPTHRDVFEHASFLLVRECFSKDLKSWSLHLVQAIDLEYAAWLARHSVPWTLVFTKTDKKKKGAPGRGSNIATFQRALIEDYGLAFLPPCLATSSSAGEGRGELLRHIAVLRTLWSA